MRKVKKEIPDRRFSHRPNPGVAISESPKTEITDSLTAGTREWRFQNRPNFPDASHFALSQFPCIFATCH